MESSFTFLRLRGIPIGANWSWLFVAALITWSLASAFFPRTYPGLEPSAYWAMAVVTAVLFFGSILLHELGHAFRALTEGMRIEGITLWLFGGVAKFVGMFPSPGAEFRIAIAGPAVSVVLALGFGAAAWGGARFGWPEAFRGVADYLARINTIVVGFNLVPALPLDGGRVLRSWLWKRQESFEAATASAARAGRAFGFLLVGVGILSFFSGAGMGGLWFVFLGWFLLQAAESERAYAMLGRAFEGLRVRDLMTPDPDVVPPTITLDEFFDEISRRRHHSAYPVVDEGHVLGLVSLRLAGAVPPAQRTRASVGDVMLRPEQVPVIDPDTPVLDALDALRSGPGRALVMENGQLDGIISVSDVAHAIELEQARRPEGPPEARPAGILVWVVVGLAMLVAASLLYHPPVAVISPGITADVARDIRISGVATTEVNGRYLLTSVQLSQPSALGVAVAWLHPDREVLALSSVVPSGSDPDGFVRDQRRLFQESRTLAAAAAAVAVGMDVSITGTGAEVLDVVRGAPVAGELRPGDVIVSIEGQPIMTGDDVRSIVRSRPAGSKFAVTIERGGRRRDVVVSSGRLPQAAETVVGLGVLIQTRDLDMRLPFEVDFRQREIGGPSAGLAYALAIADLLAQEDYARGRTVAATGTIGLNGRVGPVGGVREKAAAVADDGAALFVVPAGEVDEARGEGLRVRGVETLNEALRTLTG